jgi:hypothetical protein
MTKITHDQKREWREAREQAHAAIARLNDLYAATGRTYRARLGTYGPLSAAELDGEPAGADDPGDLDDLDDLDDPDGLSPDRSRDRIGSEHAEVEDEAGAEVEDE